MISIFTAFSSGIKDVYKNKSVVLIFYLIQFIFAYFLTKPFTELLTKTFSKSTLSDVILQKFNYIYFSIMFRDIGKGVSLFGLFLPVLILYSLIIIFLTAGIYWLFFSKVEFKLSEFFTRCGNYFSRFFKLYSISFLFYIGCILVFFLLYWLKSSLTEDSISEVWPVILTFASFGILAMLIAMVMMLFDYAKVVLITETHTGMYSALKEAAMFFMMNFFKTIGIYLLYILTTILLFVIFKFIDSFIVTDTFFAISIYFVLSQIFVFVRQYLRLALFDSIIVYYQKSMTAMPGMLNKEMLEMAVMNYEKRTAEEKDK
jgi:hypothetical protein